MLDFRKERDPNYEGEAFATKVLIGSVVLGSVTFGVTWFNRKLQSFLGGSNHSINLSSVFLGSVVISIAIILLIAGYTALERFYKKKAEMQYMRLFPHAGTSFNEKDILHLVAGFHHAKRPFWERILKGREWFQMYFVCVHSKEYEQGEIQIYIGFPKDRAGYIPRHIQNCYSQGEMKKVSKEDIPFLIDKGVGGTLRVSDTKMAGLPFKSLKQENISKILFFLKPNTALAISFSPQSLRKLKKSIKKTKKNLLEAAGINRKETMRGSMIDPDIAERIDRIDDRGKLTQAAFETSIHIWNSDSNLSAIHSIANEINASLSAENSFHLKKRKKNPIQYAPYRYWYQKKMLLTAPELSILTHLPRGMTAEERGKKLPHLYDRLPHIMSGQNQIPDDEFRNGIHIGQSLSPVQEYREIHLIEDVLRKMSLIVGKTGSGKSAVALTIMRYLVLQRMSGAPISFTAVDPKSTLAKNTLTFLSKLVHEGIITEEQKELFHYFDVGSQKYTFSLNPLEKPPGTLTESQKAAISQNTLSVMRNAFGGESIQFERFARLAIQCLLEDDQPHTILAIGEFLAKESPLRNRIFKKLAKGNTGQKRLAKQIAESHKSFGGADIQPVLNRMTRLEENPTTRRIFGQFKTNINALKYMQENHIVLFNIEGLGKEEIKLVMGYILMEYHKGANKRRNPAENHFFIIDEAHEVQLDILHTHILPKDREFGLCMMLLTQFLDQFRENLLLTVKELSGTYMACVSGEETARVIEKITTKRCSREDVQNLRSLTAVVDTEDKKGDRITFMIKTDPPYVYGPDGTPTYFGEDRTRRDIERNQAYHHAMTTLGVPLMKRDCREVSTIDKEIDEYRESLWKEDPDQKYPTRSAPESYPETVGITEEQRKEVAAMWGE